MGANTLCVSDTLCGRHLEITKFLRNITKNGIQHGQDDNVYCLLELMEKTKKKQSFLSLHQHAVLFPGRIFLVLVFLLILDLSLCCWWITSANPVSFLEGKFSFFFTFYPLAEKKSLFFSRKYHLTTFFLNFVFKQMQYHELKQDPTHSPSKRKKNNPA